MGTPLIQVSTLAPFFGALQQAGLSPATVGGKVGLTAEMLADPRALAPAQSVYRFAERAARDLDDPFLGVTLGLSPEITNWSVISEALSGSRVMIEFFARFLLTAQKFTTNVDFRLELGPEISVFERDRGFRPRTPPGQIDALSVGIFVNLFKMALGNGWKPSEMVFNVCDPKVAKVPDIGKCVLVKGNPRTLTISFPSAWLVHPIQRKRGRPVQGATSKPPSDALIASIRSNVRANISNPEFGVPILVEQMGFNRRDVQKYLRDRGSGLADLIEDERRKLASDLLDRGELTLQDIASALGYTDVSNFSRAFRRWTGVAPSRWRDANLKR